jgi:hypothetical protein
MQEPSTRSFPTFTRLSREARLRIPVLYASGVSKEGLAVRFGVCKVLVKKILASSGAK